MRVYWVGVILLINFLITQSTIPKLPVQRKYTTLSTILLLIEIKLIFSLLSQSEFHHAYLMYNYLLPVDSQIEVRSLHGPMIRCLVL